MPSYQNPRQRNMDILYLLLPIIGAFILLFLVCCFGRKVKEMLHFPKELVLGRNFPGPSSSSVASSRSSLSNYGQYERGRMNEVDEGPTIVVNISRERQRVLNQRQRSRHHYSQVPSNEDFSFLQNNSSSTDIVPAHGASSLQLSRISALKVLNKSKYKRSDSCPLMSDLKTDEDSVFHNGFVNGRLFHPLNMHKGAFNCNVSMEIDSDSDIPDHVALPSGRHRHRSNSDSDIPRCFDTTLHNYFKPNRFSQFSHKLASNEILLHVPVDNEHSSQRSIDISSIAKAEVG